MNTTAKKPGLNFDFLQKLGKVLMTVIAAWVLDKKLFREEITTHGKYGVRLYPYYLFMLKYIVPVTIVLLFLNQIRII